VEVLDADQERGQVRSDDVEALTEFEEVVRIVEAGGVGDGQDGQEAVGVDADAVDVEERLRASVDSRRRVAASRSVLVI